MNRNVCLHLPQQLVCSVDLASALKAKSRLREEVPCVYTLHILFQKHTCFDPVVAFSYTIRSRS